MLIRLLSISALLLVLCGLLGGCNSDNNTADPSKNRSTTVNSSGDNSNSESSVRIGSIGSSKPARRNTKTAKSTTQSPRITPIDENTTEPTVIVYGRVTTANGDPVSSVAVTLKGTSLEDLRAKKAGNKIQDEAVTNDKGEYEVRGAVLFTNVLEVSGDIPDMMSVLDRSKLYSAGRHAPNPGVTRIEQNFEVLKGYPISGRVVNEKGEPMAGLPVYVRAKLRRADDYRSMNTQKTTSTAAGSFEMDNLPAGEWLIGTIHPDYAAVTEIITVPTTGPVTLRLAARGGTVTGHVIDKATGAAAANVEVRLQATGTQTVLTFENMGSLKTKSSADGSFRFDHVSTGPNWLRVLPQKDALLGTAPPTPDNLSVVEGKTTDVTVYVYPGHTITGRVYDKDTGDALAGVKVTGGVSVISGVSETTSDADGHYKIEHVFSNVHSGDTKIVGLSAKLEGFSPEVQAYQSGVQVTLPWDTLEITKDIPMVKKLMVHGVVVTSTDKPIPHASVTIYNNRTHSQGAGTMTVNHDGTFELETLPFVQNVIEAKAKGYGPEVSNRIDVNAEDVDGIKIVMEPGGTVEGRVLDPNGQPVIGAEVSQNRDYAIFSTYSNAAVSGENGVFIINDAPRKVELKAKMEKYADSEVVAVSLAPGETRSGVDITLRQALTISGRVLDASRNPVIGTSLSFQNIADNIYKSANTDKDGKFDVGGLAEGLYEINVFSKPNKRVTGIKAGTQDLEIILDGAKEDEGPNKLIGTVVDDATSKPLSDFEISGFNDQITKLKEPGKFLFTGMRDNVGYSIEISSPGYDTQKFSTNTGSGGETVEQEFRLGKSGAIIGRLVEAGTGKPVPGTTVINWGSAEYYEQQRTSPKSHTITDDKGNFVLAPAPAGRNHIVIKPAEPFSEKNIMAQVTSEQTENLGDIELNHGGTINGIVVRGDDEEPVANQSIQLSGYQEGGQIRRNTTTGSDGKFTFDSLPAMHYTVSAGSINKSVNIETEGTANVRIVFGGVTVTGTITRNGIPVRASVSASGPDNQRISVYAQSGEYKLESAIPGSYKFSIYPQDQNSGRSQLEETVEIPDQAEFVKDFQLPNGRIDVTVINAAGEPVQGAIVSLTQKSSNTGFDQRWLVRTGESKVTDANGSVTFEGMQSGTFGVSARKEGVGTAMKPDVQVNDSGAAQVQLQLSNEGGTLVSVALSYTTGKGIPEAWCYLHGPNGPFVHSAKRGADGVMTIENIPPGTYTTNVSYWSHSQSEKTVEIKANETVRIEDVLYPAGAIHWHLKKADGSPAAGATVTVTPINTDPPEEQHTGRSADNGQFVQRGLAGGTYQATARLDGKPAVTETFTLAAGQNVEKTTTAPGW